MPAKTDTDALKIFAKSRTNETECRQKIKNRQTQLKVYTGKNNGLDQAIEVIYWLSFSR